ncbi:MAG TPA: ABC transporter permease subunit [Ilumatobacter sp.]|nr:ABC transporter permease subunit [Ilumatobacter sp.]
MTSIESELRPVPRVPLWRNERVLKIVAQIVAVAVVVALLRWLIGNLTTNLNRVGISTDFGVLRQSTNFTIRDDPGFAPNSPVFPNMLWVGVKNTAIASVVGIAIAVGLGVLIGVGRLSSNWLVRKLCTVYVEIIRNIPPLAIIIFFGYAVFTYGPFPIFNPRNPPWQVKLPGSDNNFLILSNDRWAFPSFMKDGNVGIFWILVLVAVAAAIVAWKWRTKVNVDTGAPHHRVVWAFGVLVVLAVIAFLATGVPYRWSWPAVSASGRTIVGGFGTNAGYLSITGALGLYHASHIAEITRGSILAVPRGQSEASLALALGGFQRYRFVILPQAAKIGFPPIISQFLSLTKNTSLATVVAYPEVTSLVTSAIGNGKPAVQMLVALMAIYLLFSFAWSVLLNSVGRKFKEVSR